MGDEKKTAVIALLFRTDVIVEQGLKSKGNVEPFGRKEGAIPMRNQEI